MLNFNKELNSVNIGLKITCNYTYGRYKKPEKIRFICKEIPIEIISEEDKKYIQM